MIPLAFAAFIGIFTVSTAVIDGLGSDALASVGGTTAIHSVSKSQSTPRKLAVKPAVASVAASIAQEKKAAELILPDSQETITGEKVTVIDTPKARTAMEFRKDDEKSDDWVK
jgi:hypothetical protein